LASQDFDQVVEQYHRALIELGKGNSEPTKEMFSRREDVSAAGGFGGVLHGWKQVAENTEFAASRFKRGEASSFESVVKYATPDLGYVVEIERYRAKLVGREDVVPVALRVTSIFRREDGIWRLVHCHGDPITSIQATESVIQK
jgi:ketosteroid isomerase-like protein